MMDLNIKHKMAISNRPIHTYSIVARDPATGEIGVAVQSHWFSVGAVVPWVEAEVGGVATQSIADPSYGKLSLDLMRAGKSAPQALSALLASDQGRELRQVAMIDAQGRVAAHTGELNIPAAGHQTGENYSVQANLMLNDRVWPAMADAFESAEGDLAERMMQALEAAQAVGGDIRGEQSAALVVVAGRNTGQPWSDRRFDLRVEDSSEPLRNFVVSSTYSVPTTTWKLVIKPLKRTTSKSSCRNTRRLKIWSQTTPRFCFGTRLRWSTSTKQNWPYRCSKKPSLKTIIGARSLPAWCSVNCYRMIRY
jgi:uncharacterized Ntn-hydrolase superfamily protein